jgi:RimJ/RimL family protein N-acetyltransferase
MAGEPRQRRLTDPGALLATTHDAGAGLRVRLRLGRPSDTPRVRDFLEGLSAESRRRRFLAPTPRIAEAVVRHFTYFDPRERLVVAAAAPVDGSEEIVGLADVVLLSTGLAELGVVVADEHQGRGLGTLLTEAVASLAIQQGATHLKAELFTDNAPIGRAMERLGQTVRTTENGRAVLYTKLPPARRRAA